MRNREKSTSDCVAILLARGGSKRIPRKNIREFLGKPVLAYPLQAASESGIFDEIIISTDDPEIAEVARRHGASVPFLRSSETAHDQATTAEALQESLAKLETSGRRPIFVCCIYATAVFLTPELIRQAHSALLEGRAESVVPVVRFEFPIQRALSMEGGYLGFMNPEYALTRSQDLEPAYHDCGMFYFLKVDTFLAQKQVFALRALGIEVSPSMAQDIDTEDDWEMAEFKFRHMTELKRKI